MPPAGVELKVRSEVGSNLFLRAMCFGLTVIVSAFVGVGAQRCQAHVEPYSHSSNTFLKTVFDTSVLSVNDDGPTYLKITVQQQQ